MAGTIKIVASKTVDNGPYRRPAVGSQQRKYLQTTPGGGSPGAVDVGESEVVVDFGDLTSPGIVRLENLSSEYDVEYGPESGGAMVLLGTLRKQVVDGDGNLQYDGGVAILELAAGVTFRMRIADEGSGSGSGSEAPSARVQVDAEDL